MNLLADLRDEFYSKTLRRLMIITELSKRRKYSAGVPLRHLVMADLLICNSDILQRFLASFGKPQQSLRINDVLYNDNIAVGSADDTRDCARTMIFLIKRGFVQFELQGGTPTFISLWNEKIDTPLASQWLNDINEILPQFVARSESILHQHILGVA